jgi:hypothetical protein
MNRPESVESLNRKDMSRKTVERRPCMGAKSPQSYTSRDRACRVPTRPSERRATRLTSQKSRTVDQRVSRSRVRPSNHGARPSHTRESVAASVGLQIRRTSASSCSCRAFTQDSNPTLSYNKCHYYKHLHEYLADSESTLSLNNNINVISMLVTKTSITCSVVYEFIRIWRLPAAR